MKIVIYLLFVVLTSPVNAQADSSIAGVWKVFSIASDGIYYNIKKDSISFSTKHAIKYSDSAEVKQLRDRMQSIYSTIKFHFDSGGIFKQSRMGTIVNEGSYRAIPSKNVIEIITKNSLNEDVVDKAKYHVEKGLLFLFMKWDDVEFDFALEKD